MYTCLNFKNPYVDIRDIVNVPSRSNKTSKTSTDLLNTPSITNVDIVPANDISNYSSVEPEESFSFISNRYAKFETHEEFTKSKETLNYSKSNEEQGKSSYLYYFMLDISVSFNHCYYIISIEQKEKSDEIKNKLIEQLTEFFDTNEVFVKEIRHLGTVPTIYKSFIDIIPKKLTNTPKKPSVDYIFSEICKLDDKISSHIEPYCYTSTKPYPNKYIVYNNQNKICKYFENIDYNLEKSLNIFTELNIIPCLIDGVLNSKFNELFDNKLFNSFDDVKSLYHSIEQLENTIKDKVEQTTKSTEPIDSEEKRVKDWILFNYEISGNSDPEYRMKAAHLSDLLEDRLNIKPSDKLSFRNRLSKYLLGIGLNKKRFSDGFYYFGICSKAFIKSKESNKLSLEQILKDRQDQLKQLENRLDGISYTSLVDSKIINVESKN